MKKNNAKIIRDTIRFLKRSKEYREVRELGYGENYEVQFILKNGSKDVVTDVIAYAFYDDMGISFCPYDESSVSYLYGWSFCYDEDLFAWLEEGYEIVSMSMDSHFFIWSEIVTSQQEDIVHHTGMQKYLAFCKINGISAKLLQKSSPYSGMDVITLYDDKE